MVLFAQLAVQCRHLAALARTTTSHERLHARSVTPEPIKTKKVPQHASRAEVARTANRVRQLRCHACLARTQTLPTSRTLRSAQEPPQGFSRPRAALNPFHAPLALGMPLVVAVSVRSAHPARFRTWSIRRHAKTASQATTVSEALRCQRLAQVRSGSAFTRPFLKRRGRTLTRLRTVSGRRHVRQWH